MKTLYSFIALLSFNAMASVVPYNPKQCMPEIANEIRVFTQGTLRLPTRPHEFLIDVTGMMGFMTDFLNQIENSLLDSRDLATLKQIRPLCVGMFEEPTGPNAIAIGKDHLFFGINLLRAIQVDWQLDAETGIKVILAHEYAHIIQNRLEIPFNLPLPMRNTKNKELQADCLAGILLSFHHPVGKNLIVSDRIMQIIGDHHIVGDHGTYHQRRTAILEGMKQALILNSNRKGPRNTTTRDMVKACSLKYPAYP